MLLGIAIERGLVRAVDATLGELLGGHPRVDADPRKAGITLEQLLTMRSCLECNDWDEPSPGNEERMYPREDWVRFALELPPRGELPLRGDLTPRGELPLRGELTFSYCTAGVVRPTGCSPSSSPDAARGVPDRTATGTPFSVSRQRKERIRDNPRHFRRRTSPSVWQRPVASHPLPTPADGAADARPRGLRVGRRGGRRRGARQGARGPARVADRRRDDVRARR